jgi:hypothetical protein
LFNKISFIYHHIYFENSNRLRDYFNVYVQMSKKTDGPYSEVESTLANIIFACN